jgi:hypothetical protein
VISFLCRKFLEEMTPEERKRFEYLRRVAQILRMPPDELIRECDEIMAPKGQPEPEARREGINRQREILRSQGNIDAALIGPPNDAVTYLGRWGVKESMPPTPYIPLALRK